MRLVTLVRRVLDAAGNAGLSRKGRQEQAAGPDQDLDRHHSFDRDTDDNCDNGCFFK